MLILGISGGSVEIDQATYPVGFHDSTACLVEDGALVCAVEEERLNRVKKGMCFPVRSIRACLDQRGVTLSEVDAVAFYFAEDFIDRGIELSCFEGGARASADNGARQIIRILLRREFDVDIPDEKLIFVPHHIAHGSSSFAQSGMSEALVVVMDGSGEMESGTVFRGDIERLEELKTFPLVDSLGFLYLAGTKFLGYGFGDEYKVMGLAPYGDAKNCRDLFQSLYTLKDDGDYELYSARSDERYFALGLYDIPYTHLARACASAGLAPRKKGEKFTKQHLDFAAALQEAIERIALHVLKHWARVTGQRKLCFSGGVAHNSTLNGVILRSKIFDEVFVHPASHDAGAAEGAAQAVCSQLGGRTRVEKKLRTASFGPPLDAGRNLAQELDAWCDLIGHERVDDVVEVAADLLSRGAVLGWAFGRSEFGPRALGNRSILADPRPPDNRNRINILIKEREDFRPFAPVVIPEAADDYFELPATDANYDFMSYVVPVRHERREELGAVTHVDGSARVQIVDPQSNERFYRLVKRFGELTGTPVLLNTSFNNNVEPIVQTVNDVLTCYLTTGLDYLIIEDFLVKRLDGPLKFDDYLVRMTPNVSLVERVAYSRDRNTITHQIQFSGEQSTYYDCTRILNISQRIFKLLSGVREPATLRVLAESIGGLATADREELLSLWRERLLMLTPAKVC